MGIEERGGGVKGGWGVKGEWGEWGMGVDSEWVWGNRSHRESRGRVEKML